MRANSFLLISLASLTMIGGCAQTASEASKTVAMQTVDAQVVPDTIKTVEAQAVVSQITPNIPKNILLRSKGMKPYTVRERVEEKTDDGFRISYKDVEKSAYEEFTLELNFSYTEEALPFLNNQDLQEDLAKFISATDKYTDSLAVKILSQVKSAKSLGEALDKLSKVEGYDFFVLGEDSASFNAEVNRYPDNKKISAIKNVKITEENGVVRAALDKSSTGGELSESYDVELGKRILVSDLLLDTKRKNEWGGDSSTLVSVYQIRKNQISFHDNEGFWVGFKENDSLLTDYAKSLMARDKGYTKSTTTNAFGDKIQKYHFEDINDSPEDRDVLIPLELNGCANTMKMRNRMLDIMFGRHDGNMDTLIAEGVKTWIPEYERGKSMLLQLGDGLVSFGFEDQSRQDNLNNVFVVFDKTSGEEITANELIKDKDEFMKFVNSHNLNLAGFLFDTTNAIDEQLKKFGEQFRIYLRHSVGMGPFPGLNEFPTSWWYSFNKMDEIIPVEFNTATSRIFLDYADIKKFMNPKYVKILDQAVKSIRKE